MFGCSCCCLGYLLIIGGVVLIGLLFSKKDPPKIAGVYSQRGKWYWGKVLSFYLLMKVRKWKDDREKKEQSRSSTSSVGYGVTSKSRPEEMEKVQALSPHFQAIDAVYFNGANQEGFAIVSGMARRPHGVVNGFFIFRIPGVGYLVSPKFPDSMLFGGGDGHYGAEGFRYEPIVPMKHWRLQYNGQLKFQDNPSKKVQVHFEADWKTELDYFDFDSMVPPWTMAKGIALESWSREYFQALKDAHQTHYEGMGNLIGEIEVDGKKYNFNMPSMRDHSYGIKRNWKLLHRYNMHMFSLEDGRRFDIGNICHPSVSSRLELGYMYDHDGSLHALESVDLSLQYHGEGGDPPTDYGMIVKATNGHSYYVQVKVLESLELHIGWEWEARIVERRCKFIVDGIEGIGISEVMYRGTGDRPQEYKSADPEWVQNVKTLE